MPPSAHPGSPLPWGTVGVENVYRALYDGSGRSGVVRTVEEKVRYEANAPRELLAHVWRKVEEYPLLYELAWDKDPGGVCSLDALAAAVRDKQRLGTLAEDDPDLDDLDGAAVQLVGLVERLQAAGWGPDLLNPKSVLVVRGSKGRGLVLPDYGFIWEGDSDDWLVPAWVAPEGEYNEKNLYDLPPREQQLVAAAAAVSLNDPGPAAHVPLLARALAAALNGKPSRAVRPVAPSPPAAAGAPQGRTTRDALWDVLARAAAPVPESSPPAPTGKGNPVGYSTPADFAAALAKARLRSHFLPRRVGGGIKPNGTLVYVAGGLVVAAAVCVGLYLAWPSLTSHPGSTTPATTPQGGNGGPPSAAIETLKDLKKAVQEKSPDEQKAAFTRAAKSDKWPRLRQSWFEDWNQRRLQAVEEMVPGKQEIHDELKALLLEIDSAIDTLKASNSPPTEEERSCRDGLELLLGQLPSLE